jgi:GH15 family glucan-1,4-alpha-glucosidase
MAYKPISEYGVIGDMHSAALVGSDGSIDWLCFPRFDSPSVFGAILDDARGGRFQIGPLGPFRSHQAYLPDGNVLATTFEAAGGTAAVIDFMPVCEDVTSCDHEVIRLVRCQEGHVDLLATFQPCLNYARDPTILQVEHGLALARQGQDCLSLSADVPLETQDGTVSARFGLDEGQWTAFLLRWQDDSPPAIRDYDVFGKLGKTQAFWHFVGHDWRYPGRWQDAVKRSMLALHLLLYVPTGAICAAATTSLPGVMGGQRNWDYRYCWLRDAAFTMDTFHRLGHTTYSEPYMEWLGALCLAQGENINSLYGIGREADPQVMGETVLDHLEGYRGSRPVRIGNQAFQQRQLDIYGEALLSLDSYQRAGGVITGMLWALAENLVEAAIRFWQEPDNSIWEIRAEPRDFTYSKLMCWVALDRGLRLARVLRRPVDYQRWRQAREAIKQDILEKAWNSQREAFVQTYGSQTLDASLLFMPIVGFLPGADPRVASTIRMIREELAVDGLVYRYRPDGTPDGLSGDEGTFTMCSLWLAGALAASGDLDGAQHVFRRVLDLRNHVGL